MTDAELFDRVVEVHNYYKQYNQDDDLSGFKHSMDIHHRVLNESNMEFDRRFNLAYNSYTTFVNPNNRSLKAFIQYLGQRANVRP